MDFRLLGPLEVLENGRALDLGGAKQRALLAVLLLHANRVVSSDHLLEALWGERPPGTAQKALQVYVSQLRKILGKERILTKSPGYQARVEEGELDLERFQRLIGEGKLEEALSLFRGAPLADFAYEPFAQPEIARLEELRLAYLEERIEDDLARGRHGALVGELEALVREHPLRERLRGQLMRALYRSGRQAEALEAYQAGRRYLSEELGLEPGEALKELQRAILAHDPELELRETSLPAEEREPPKPPATAEQQAREVRKTVTVLFMDLTPVGRELDPESLRRMTARGFDVLLPALERHGAIVERSLGGAVTGIFGIPAVHEDDALRSVRAATEMREALEGLLEELKTHWGAWLELRVGLSTGEVVTGGEGSHPFATGEPVQSAIRLQQAASPGELLMTDRTYRLVQHAVDAEPVGENVRLHAVTSRPAGHPRRIQSPMVGRARERRRLQDAFEQAVGDRSCQLFTILGAAGVGKSRLVQEFLGDIAADSAIARGRCLPYGEGITYWPLLEAVKDAVGLDDSDSPEQGRAKLVQALDEEPDAELVAQRVAELVGLVEGGSSVDEGFGAVRSLFEAIARVRSLVLVFDDIHWGEATFLDLVEHLADWARDAPILLVCLARPELLDGRPGWGGGKLNATTTLLEPLSDEECALLIENLVGRAGLADEVEARIADAAEGNPLFVEEMISILIDDGLLVREDGRWAATGDISAVRVPPTIQALLAARLDRLHANQRAVIERAAVVGKVFYEEAVIELAPDDLQSAVGDSLGALVRKELIRPDRPSLGGRTFRFRHLLIRDAAYESIPKEARAELHERFGRWLERAAGERVIEYGEFVGYHLEQAYRYLSELGPVDDGARAIAREAAERLGAAGRRAFLRSDAPAAVNLISRSVALLPADDPLRVDLVPNVRAVQGMSDLVWADRVLTEAIEAAATTGDRRLAANALVQRGFLRLFTEPEVTPGELIEVAERAIAVFEELGDELGLARAWRLVAQAHYLGRHLALCAEASERSLEHARVAGDRFEEREIVEWLVIALLLGPAPAPEATRRCERLLEETADDPLLEAEILGGLVPLLAMQGHTDQANEAMERSRRIMDEAGVWIWVVTFWYASAYFWWGDPVSAENELRPGYEALKKIGEKSHFSSIAHALSNAVYLQGRYDEAEQLTRECEEAVRANDVHSQVHWRSTRAKLLARKGDLEEAERLGREAVAFASESDFYPAHADALMDLAEVLDLAGDAEAAAAAMEEAIGFYRLKGNVFAADRASSIRARLLGESL